MTWVGTEDPRALGGSLVQLNQRPTDLRVTEASRRSDLSKHPVRQRSERHPDPDDTAIRFAIRKIRYSTPKGHRPTPLAPAGVPGR